MKHGIKSFKRVIAVLLMCVTMAGASLTAFAAEPIDSWVAANCPEANGGDWGNASLGGYFSSTSTGMTSPVPITVTIDSSTVTYYYDSANEEKIIAKINSVGEMDNVSEKISDVTDGLAIAADTETATTLLSGVLPYVRTFIGLLVIVVTVGMTIYSACDLLYINFPNFREWWDNKSGGHDGKGGKSGFFNLVTDDARASVKAAETDGGNGKNPNIVYLQKRLVSYIALTILLVILVTGNITVIVDIVVRLVEGVLSMLASI